MKVPSSRNLKILCFLLVLYSACNTTMNITTLPYNNDLKKVQLDAISFQTVSLKSIPAPYYKDYSGHTEPAYKNYKNYDRFGFRDVFLEVVSKALKDTVLKIMVLTPKHFDSPYDAFAFLSNKQIAALHFNKDENFRKWMDIIFEKNYERLKKDKEEGLFQRQPELNPNPQFMLVLGQGEFSQKWVNSGMMVDERPYENTGAYLYKNAPQQYNKAKITREKQRYLKKYIDTSGAYQDPVVVTGHFNDFIKARKLVPNTPTNNKTTYKKFEQDTGFQFPKELKILLSGHNGVPTTGFLTADEILTEWQNWKTIYDDWMLADLKGNNLPDGQKTLGMYTNPYWIPFFSTSGGNFIALDYAPGSQGTSGQIIAFGADEQKIRFIAKDLSDFLAQLSKGDAILDTGF
ncbi:SMI1/KNR4 family protein [Maribacter chungangensis]|uniref:SMI1/KNR4 family protein n=1 Tax=Maribacter chungangensis TaxID=1069117 RepID=A0ABW3AYS5_9FLAO